MSRKKLPPDAFEYYFALGPGRSYRDVAEHFGVSKTAVANLAEREDWQQRVSEIDQKARARSDESTADAAAAAKEQRLKSLRMVLLKGVEGLKGMSIDSPRDATRAIIMAVRELRVELGEPSERMAVSVEDTIRREYERWMTVVGDEAEDSDDTASD